MSTFEVAGSEFEGDEQAFPREMTPARETRKIDSMTGSGGAGASVSSGAGFQARVAAYVLLSAMCEMETEFGEPGTIAHVGFETRTSIDDLNIIFKDQSRIYIQAKATIGYSLDGELRSVLEQFEAQDADGGPHERYFLITSSRASKKVVFELRATWNAYRSSPEVDFFRDQPKNLSDILTEVRDTLRDIRAAANRSADPAAIDRILRKSYVLILDVEEGDTLEQAIKLVLQTSDYAAPAGVWGKAIADCITYAKTRRTVAIAAVTEGFQKFRVGSAPLLRDAADDLLRIELGNSKIAAGKEVILARALDDKIIDAGEMIVLEMLRFADDGSERLDINRVPFSLPSGETLEIILRAASVTGIGRLIKDRLELSVDKKLGVIELDEVADPEGTPSAQAHRQRLENALRQNLHPLLCVHCGEAVWEPTANLVEIGNYQTPTVGLSHDRCLGPLDRVLGGTAIPLAEKHPELVNFDVNAWVRAANEGQRAFNNLDTIRTGPVSHLLWGGSEPHGPLGQYLIEVQLQGGGFEIVTRRNYLHRFRLQEAEEFVAELNKQFQVQREIGDPICYTDESKGFGLRSLLLAQFGKREKIREVTISRARPFEKFLEAAFGRPGKWYTPVLYLRHRPTDLPFGLAGAILLLTDPLSVKLHLENWSAAGVPVEDYELIALLSDEAFDDFMRWVDDNDLFVVIDAILDPTTRQLVSGIVMNSKASFLRERAESSASDT